MTRSIVKYPATVAAAACLLVMTSVYVATGTLFPTQLPDTARSARATTGMALMLMALPPYVVAMHFVMRRRSLALVEQLRPMLPDPCLADEAAGKIQGALRRTWPIGGGLGLVAGLYNTVPMSMVFESSMPEIEGSLFLGQMFLWLLIALILCERVVVARSFSRLGEHVEFDIFRLDQLRPLVRSGMVDVLVIAGALAFSPLQSLDAEFRWYNYSFALAVAIPASIFSPFWPLRSVHARIRLEKQRQLDRVGALIERASRRATPDDVAGLESLLAHRERIRGLPTWPLDLGLLSRLLFYLVIPPLAWVAAAVVEMLVNRVVSL